MQMVITDFFLLLFLHPLTLIFGQATTVQETTAVKQVYLNTTDFIDSSSDSSNKPLIVYPSPVITLGSGANHQSLKLRVDWTIPVSTNFTSVITIQTIPPSPLVVVMYHLNLTVKVYTTVQLSPLDEGKWEKSSSELETLAKICRLIPKDNMSCGRDKNGSSCFSESTCPTPHFSNLNSYASELNITINHSGGSTLSVYDHIEFCFVVTPFTPASGSNLNCPFHLFNCGNGRCLDPSLVQDGINQCGNNYDEVPVNQYGWNSWTTGAKVATLVYIICFYGILAALAWITCLKGIIVGKRLNESKEEKEEDNNSVTVVHAGGNQEGMNSKLKGVNQVDHQEMREMTATKSLKEEEDPTSKKPTGSSSSAPVVTLSNLSGPHRALRSSLRNKNLDPKLKALSTKGEVNVAFSSDEK